LDIAAVYDVLIIGLHVKCGTDIFVRPETGKECMNKPAACHQPFLQGGRALGQFFPAAAPGTAGIPPYHK